MSAINARAIRATACFCDFLPGRARAITTSLRHRGMTRALMAPSALLGKRVLVPGGTGTPTTIRPDEVDNLGAQSAADVTP